MSLTVASFVEPREPTQGGQSLLLVGVLVVSHEVVTTQKGRGAPANRMRV